jgi:hypothetical protein
MTARPRYLVELEALPDFPAEPPRRLARVLKYALRAVGLRCLRAEELASDGPPGTARRGGA